MKKSIIILALLLAGCCAPQAVTKIEVRERVDSVFIPGTTVILTTPSDTVVVTQTDSALTLRANIDTTVNGVRIKLQYTYPQDEWNIQTRSHDTLVRYIARDSIIEKPYEVLRERVPAIIHARTLRGEFLPGSTSLGYSTKNAGMPFGALAEKIGKEKAASVLRQIKNGSADKVFTGKSGKMWIELSGGYKRMRELAGKETDRVTLNWSGSMMRSLKAQPNAATSSVLIYFTNSEAEQLATYHHVGAGRNKIKRKFMGLTEQELHNVEQWLGEKIAEKIKFALQ